MQNFVQLGNAYLIKMLIKSFRNVREKFLKLLKLLNSIEKREKASNNRREILSARKSWVSNDTNINSLKCN